MCFLQQANKNVCRISEFSSILKQFIFFFTVVFPDSEESEVSLLKEKILLDFLTASDCLWCYELLEFGTFVFPEGFSTNPLLVPSPQINLKVHFKINGGKYWRLMRIMRFDEQQPEVIICQATMEDTSTEPFSLNYGTSGTCGQTNECILGQNWNYSFLGTKEPFLQICFSFNRWSEWTWGLRKGRNDITWS